MPRRHETKKYPLIPDPVYNSELVARFINSLMKQGKKSVAQRILYGSFAIIEEKVGKPPLEVFNKALDNVKPELEVKSRRVGGATYQVPMEVRPARRTTLAIRWIVKAARALSGHSMKEKLASELIDASKNQGTAVKKKEDTHKMADANKAFAHFKW